MDEHIEPAPNVAAAGDGAPTDLIGAWVAVTIGDVPVGGVESMIRFVADGHAEGHGGVNSFRGPFVIEGDAIGLGPFAATRMAGPEDAMRQEAAFLAALDGHLPFEVDGDSLLLGDATAGVRLRREDLIDDEPGSAAAAPD